MKQGPFALWTAFPSSDYYDPLRLPSGRLPLPGFAGYRQHMLPGRRPGAGEALSSSQDNLVTVPRPIRRRVHEHQLQDQWCRPWPSPLKCRLGSLLARSHGFLLRRRRLRFMLRTGHSPPPQRGVVAPLRRRPLDRRREPRYQGPWRLPGPDSHRLAALNLSLGLRHIIKPPMTGVPSCWTHTSSGKTLDLGVCGCFGGFWLCWRVSGDGGSGCLGALGVT